MNLDKKILIVDDVEQSRETLGEIFRESGFQNVITAAEGNEAIELTRKELPDLILIDIMMPNLPGGEAVRKLQADDKTKNIPVIFISGILGKGDEGKESVNIDGKMYPSIGKPYRPEELVNKVNELLN